MSKCMFFRCCTRLFFYWGSKNKFICPVRGNKMYFTTRQQKKFIFFIIYLMLLSEMIIYSCSFNVKLQDSVPGENRLRLQQACSSFRVLQKACSRPAFNHTPARGLQHTCRLNKNITFIYKCLICGRAAGLFQACDLMQACCKSLHELQACYSRKRFSPGVLLDQIISLILPLTTNFATHFILIGPIYFH